MGDFNDNHQAIEQLVAPALHRFQQIVRSVGRPSELGSQFAAVSGKDFAQAEEVVNRTLDLKPEDVERIAKLVEIMDALEHCEGAKCRPLKDSPQGRSYRKADKAWAATLAEAAAKPLKEKKERDAAYKAEKEANKVLFSKLFGYFGKADQEVSYVDLKTDLEKYARFSIQ
jgi:thioredoxin-like negative regulator of GroEL